MKAFEETTLRSVPTDQGQQPAGSVADILDRAADLIEPEGRWTQGAFARTAKGNVVGAIENPAVCWCAYGALDRACADLAPADTAWMAADALQAVLPERIPNWNDDASRTQAEVVAALRQAASAERAKLPLTGNADTHSVGTEAASAAVTPTPSGAS